jgi:hypothetical protein
MTNIGEKPAGRIVVGAIAVATGLGTGGSAVAGQAPIQFTVRPGVENPVAVQDLPNSRCGTAAENSSPSVLNILTDSQGFARFGVIQGTGSATWTLECESFGGSTRFQTFVVTASSSEPAYVAPPVKVPGTVRPPPFRSPEP